MALQTLSACCTNGYLHNGKPKGAMMSVNGGKFNQTVGRLRGMARIVPRIAKADIFTSVQTYFAVPADESTSRALVIFSDVMGHNFVNTQLLADNFAANGFFTILPDLFRGDAVPLNAPKNFDVYEWLKYHLPEHTEPIIRTVIEETYRLAQWKTIVGVGYCFGAKYVLKYLKRGLLSAGYIAHPTLLDVQDILGVERPLSVAAAGKCFADFFQSQLEC